MKELWILKEKICSSFEDEPGWHVAYEKPYKEAVHFIEASYLEELEKRIDKIESKMNSGQKIAYK